MLSASQLKLLKRIGLEGRKYLKAAIEKDESARYSLKQDWFLPAVPEKLGNYEDEAFSMVDCPGEDSTLIMVKKFESTKDNNLCDGASHAPDNFCGINFVPSAVFHDRWYASIEKISATTGIAVDKLRKIGDEIFVMIAYAENGTGFVTKTIVSMYYYGIRIFGNSHVKKLVRTATTACMAGFIFAGCSGCVNYTFPQGETYESPDYEEVANVSPDQN